MCFVESLITPEHFATILVRDLDLPRGFVPNIVSLIQAQIDAYSPLHDVTFDESEDGKTTIMIELDVSIGKMNLRDRFEWDLNTRDITPEMFARQLVADLGLGGEFVTEIANSVREQILMHIRKKITGEGGRETAVTPRLPHVQEGYPLISPFVAVFFLF